MTHKIVLISALITFLIHICFSGCIGDCGISVEKLDYIPKDYINITSEQIKEYPKINEAVSVINSDNYNKNYKLISCNQKEEEKIHDLFGGFYGSNYFKYDDEYYSLQYYSAD